MSLIISDVQIVPVVPNAGHIGFCSFLINNWFRVNEVGLYSRPEGGIRLTFPKRGELHCVFPINKTVGQQIEDEVLKKYESLF